jgi:hypothetical protein
LPSPPVALERHDDIVVPLERHSHLSGIAVPGNIRDPSLTPLAKPPVRVDHVERFAEICRAGALRAVSDGASLPLGYLAHTLTERLAIPTFEGTLDGIDRARDLSLLSVQ